MPGIREPDRHPVIHDAVPQHVRRAAGIDLPGQPYLAGTLRIIRAASKQRPRPVPFVGLGRADELPQLGSVQPRLRIEVVLRSGGIQ